MNIIPFLNPAAQFHALREEILAATASVLAGGRYILGPEVQAFESEIATQCGASFGIGANSGSDALTLALHALGVGPGDEVITSPFTYIAPAESIHQLGARIVFADIDPRSFILDTTDVARRVTKRTKAIIPVHLFGQAAPIEELLKLGLPVVEDAAQAIGARRNGNRVGSIGKIGCLSFYPTKNLGACGDGGMVITSDEALAGFLRRSRVHGISQRYHHDSHGFNTRLDELQAAILRVKLRHLEGWNARRRELAARYDEGLAGLPIELPLTTPGNEHVFHVYAIQTDRRDALQTHLADRGIPTIIYYPVPLHRQKCYADYGWRQGNFPVTERLSERILPLPMYPELTNEQVDRVVAEIRAFLG